MDFDQIIKIAPIVISLLAFLVSFVGLTFVARTYNVSHRPYVGLVSVPFQLVENPPRAIIWTVILKNVGTIPAFLKIEKNVAKIIKGNQTSNLSQLGNVDVKKTMLMPGETTELLGQYTEVGGNILMSEIINGNAVLEIEVLAAYEFPSFLWKGSRKYNAIIQFHSVKGVDPGFIMVNAEAN